MPEMKDSGIEWIGSIPSHWEVKPLKYNFVITSGSTPDSSIQEFWDGDILWITPADFKTKDYYTAGGHRNISELGFKSCSTNMIPANSIIFSKRAPIGSVVVNTVDLCTNQGCLACIPKEKINTKFYYYVMSIYEDVFNLFGSGTTFKEISATVFGNMCFAEPPIIEQQKISDFLDQKCFEIDALTADIQSQIDILEEYKKSVITESVTKGLNPNVEMKDSGVAWCPKIPKHWEYVNPKALFKLRENRAIPNERQLTASQELGIVYQDEYMEMTGNRVVTVMKDFSILKHVEPGDFVISMRSFQGGLEYSEKRGCISSAYVMLVPDNRLIYPPFYRWFFKSSKYINAIQSTSNLVRDGQAMRYSNFAQVPLFLIPMEEQKEVAEYLNKKIKNIDIVISEKRNQLDILIEYKKSLIYEYVTGKKEVPTDV